jgi:hypothetical protein
MEYGHSAIKAFKENQMKIIFIFPETVRINLP